MRRGAIVLVAAVVVLGALVLGVRLGLLQEVAATGVRARVVALGPTPAHLLGTGRIPVYTVAGQAAFLDATRQPVLFVATWCPHCQQEVPQLERQVADGRIRRPVVVSTLFFTGSFSADETATQGFIKRFNLDGWPVYLQRGNPWPYTPKGVPELLTVQNGKVVRYYGKEIAKFLAIKP